MMAAPTTTPRLHSAHLARAYAALDAATRDLTPAQLSFHAPGKWCATEILEHLTITFDTTARRLEKLAQKEEVVTLRPTLQQRAFAGVVTGFGYLPSGRKAPDFTVPTGLDADVVLRRIREDLVAMDAALHACIERFGQRRRIANHPVLGPLNARQWARFHWVHTRHHLRQIEQLKQ